MPITPTDAAILGSVFHGHAGDIDKSGFQPEWCESDTARAVLSAILSLSRQGKVTNVLNIMALCPQVNKGEWGQVINISKNGFGDVDYKQAVNTARASFIARKVETLQVELQEALTNRRYQSVEWVSGFAKRFSSLSELGKIETGSVKDAYNEPTPELKFNSTIHEFNRLLRGGYRAGVFIVYVGVSGHGKSTIMYSHAVDVVRQGHKVVFITNENTTRDVVNRILRGLSGLSAEEVSTRHGSNPERQEMLDGWVEWMEEHMRVYDATAYTTSNISRIAKWDKPDVMLVDYIMDVQGMLSGVRFSKDPVGDMAYHLRNVAIAERITLITGGQMSDDNAAKFKKNDASKSAIMYGTSRPFHASNIYHGLKRDNYRANVGYFRCWKDNIGNEIDTHENVPFDPNRWVFTGSKTKENVA